MNRDDGVLSPREHDEMRDLVLAGTQRIRPAGDHRARFVAASAALVLVGVVAGGVLVAALRDGRMPGPVASGDSQQTATIPNGGTPPPSTAFDVDPEVWISELPAGERPLVPYWHEGVLHVAGVEINTPFEVGAIEVAGDTVMVGSDLNRGVPTRWWLVRDGELEPLPATDEYYPALSADGSIAFWQTRESGDATTFVMWDTRSNRELATHTVSGRFGTGNRLQMIGVDAAGIAYWVDQSSETPVMRWDVRADVVEATALPWDSSKTFEDQAAPIPDLFVGLADAYVSPDGTREVFTAEAPGDSPVNCCAAQLRVRPTGSLTSVDPADITPLQLPDGIPNMRLWDAYTDRGTWGVWWETNETILLDAVIGGQSHLVRCWASGGSCELVFDLGANSSSGIVYIPEWQQDWAFGRFPVTE
jgi:hypothetical protein